MEFPRRLLRGAHLRLAPRLALSLAGTIQRDASSAFHKRVSRRGAEFAESLSQLWTGVFLSGRAGRPARLPVAKRKTLNVSLTVSEPDQSRAQAAGCSIMAERARTPALRECKEGTNRRCALLRGSGADRAGFNAGSVIRSDTVKMRLSFRIALSCVAAASLGGCFPWKAPPRIKEYRSLQEALEQKDQVTAVNLSAEALESFPEELTQLPNLERLSLRQNNIGSLPPALGALGKLVWLDLGQDHLTGLPEEIGKLSSLVALYLNDNQLTSLPPSIGKLSALRYLNLDRNQLTVLGDEIGQLKELRWLRLNDNQLASLSPAVGALQNLERLYLRNNRLTQLPSELGGLKALTDLSLTKNQLATLPAWIAQLPSLQRLDLEDNGLTSLPPEMAEMKTLRWLRLDRNPLPGADKAALRQALPDCTIIF